MNKEKILNTLKENITKELAQAKEAYKSTQNLVTADDMKSEGKYDTRSIEAGYLAGAQKKRVDELELELNLLDEIDLKHLNDTVSVGSLVEISFNDIKRPYFISSTSGGSMIRVEGQVVLVISAFSPIGTEVIGLKAGDQFEVVIKGESREYEIVKIS